MLKELYTPGGVSVHSVGTAVAALSCRNSVGR